MVTVCIAVTFFVRDFLIIMTQILYNTILRQWKAHIFNYHIDIFVFVIFIFIIIFSEKQSENRIIQLEILMEVVNPWSAKFSRNDTKENHVMEPLPPFNQTKYLTKHCVILLVGLSCFLISVWYGSFRILLSFKTIYMFFNFKGLTQ